MTGQYRRRAGEPVDVWEVGTEPVPEWARRQHPLPFWAKPGMALVRGEPLMPRDAFARDYEPAPSPDVPAVLGTPEGNAAVVAKLHDMAESVGAVFVPDPDKLARCGGLPSEVAAGLSPEERARRLNAAVTARNDDAATPPRPMWSPSHDVREALEIAKDTLQRIVRMCPAACDMSVAHSMAEEAEDALARMGGGDG